VNARQPQPGDIVQLSDGEYVGCILTLLRIDHRLLRYVCKRSSWPYEVTADEVVVVRARD
jgi:hypothetical protein